MTHWRTNEQANLFGTLKTEQHFKVQNKLAALFVVFFRFLSCLYLLLRTGKRTIFNMQLEGSRRNVCKIFHRLTWMGRQLLVNASSVNLALPSQTPNFVQLLQDGLAAETGLEINISIVGLALCLNPSLSKKPKLRTIANTTAGYHTYTFHINATRFAFSHTPWNHLSCKASILHTTLYLCCNFFFNFVVKSVK